MIKANNFAKLKLNNLENSILTENCTLILFQQKLLRVVQLIQDTGDLVARKDGISLIPTLEKLNEDYSDSSRTRRIVDSKVEYLLRSGATLTMKKSGSSIQGILTGRNNELIVQKSSANLTSLLANVESSLISIF